MAWLVMAGTVLGGLYAWITGRSKRAAQEASAAWKSRAEHNDVRAEAAEAAVDKQVGLAKERQQSLEKEIRVETQARVDRGDPGARNRVLEAIRADRDAKAHREAGRSAAVPDGAASGSRPNRGVDPKLRGGN